MRETLYKMLDKVQELRQVEDLRELPAFNNLVSVADYILSLHMKKANLNEVCLLIERLSLYVLDYESMTPRIHHFPDIKDKIRDALYEFRQKERKSWRSLIFCQGLDEVLKDLDDCIQIKNVLIDEILGQPEEEKEKEVSRVKKILDLADTFLLKTTLIKQCFRIYWLRRTLKSLPTNPACTNTSIPLLLNHILKYHLNFQSSLLEVYGANFEAVAKPINENELLSNWHMKDMVNLKMNVTKFHKGVHRSMKIHKDVLEISVEGTIYKRRRDAYESKSPEEAIIALKDPPTFDSKKKDADKKKKAANPDETAAGEEEKTEEPKLKVLGKMIIDKIVAKSEYQEPEAARFIKANLKLFRIVNSKYWLKAGWNGRDRVLLQELRNGR